MAKENKGNKQQEEYEREVQRLRNAFNSVAKTSAGKKVFRYLMNECGFAVSGLVGNRETGEINPLGSIYNEARKDVYYKIRKFLSNENIIAIEFKEDEDE